MAIDDKIIVLSPDPAQKPEQILHFPGLFIPDQAFMQVRVMQEKAFVSFSYKHVNFSLLKMLTQLFNKTRGQNHIADKGCLYEENLFGQDPVFNGFPVSLRSK